MKQGSNFNNLENEDEVDVKISLELLKEKKFIFGLLHFTLLSIFFL